MDLITIARNGQQFGPYTLAQVHAYLQGGNLVPTDLAYDPRTQTWVPLGQLIGLAGGAPPPPPPAGGRNVAVLILVAIMWWLGLGTLVFFCACFLAGFIAGMLDPTHAHDAGRSAGAWIGAHFGLPIYGLALALSIWLTIVGKLPGTGK